ncbi:MAG: FtsX-like permease family protein [Bacteroidaceae bacterium]
MLIAAIISFLRMQVQLFWKRRREVALRITHGAKRRQVFRLLFSEVILVAGMSVVMAMLIGNWAETFIYTQFADVVARGGTCIRDIPLYCLYTGRLLLLVCGLTI